MILLNSVGEGILGAIVSIGGLMLMFVGFSWISEKFFGTRITTRSQLVNAHISSQEDERIYNNYVKTNPDLVKRAIEQCKKKGYSKTHSNILSELYKIKKEEEKRKIKETNSENINIKEQTKTYNDLKEKERKEFIKNSIILFNTLYFEFEEDIFSKKNITATDLFEIAYDKDPNLKIIDNYNNLFDLYVDEILSNKEFTDKKRKLIIELLK